MKILVVSDHQRVGGAGIAASRLAQAMLDAGHAVSWAAGVLESAPVVPSRSFRALSRVERLRAAAASRLTTAQGARIRRDAYASQVWKIAGDVSPDVIHIHNIHQFLPPELPAQLSRRWPVVWTMHDMWPFTGTCAYDFGCGAFQSACHSRCPRADRYPSLSPKAVPRAFRRRRNALGRAGRIAFAAPSQWLCNQAMSGLLRGRDVTPIANCIDLTVFRPLDRVAARDALGLPQDEPLVLAPAPGSDARKGGDVWLAALAQLHQGRFVWVQLGDAASMRLPGWVRRVNVPAIRDERLLALLYSAVDLQILPTRADNLPNVILEALACGTPTLAAAVGGVPEAVVEGRTGWLTSPNDAAALAGALPGVIAAARADTGTLRTACRAFAEKHYDPSRQAAAYTHLFERLIGIEADSPLPRLAPAPAGATPIKEAA